MAVSDGLYPGELKKKKGTKEEKKAALRSRVQPTSRKATVKGVTKKTEVPVPLITVKTSPVEAKPNTIIDEEKEEKDAEEEDDSNQ